MNKKISLFILIILTLSLFGSSPTPVHAQDWWNQNWSYRVTIEIDRTKIEAIVLTDFPVLIYLNSTKINWAHVQDDLDDLRFIDGDDITQLYAELENYTVNDEAWIWVKLPNIWMMVGEPNQAFYLYYGNNAVSSWWNPEDVWEDSAVMVQHMTDNPDNAHVMDSTQYDNDGIKKGANEPIETAGGEIDSAQNFDGEDDYIQAADSPSLSPADQVTVECWVKYDALENVGLVWKGGYNYMIYGPEGGFVRFICFDSSGGVSSARFPADLIQTGTWYHIIGVLGPDHVARLYLDGQPVGSVGNAIAGIRDQGGDLFLGKRGDGGAECYLYGLLDEARVYNAGKSAEWVLADYNSGADTLLIYGAESLCPLALTVRYNIGINKLYINGTQRANNTTVYIDKYTIVNATAISQSNYIFYRHILGLGNISLIPMYLFNITQSSVLWSYATPNFYIYEEPTTFTFSQWMILLFVALVISLLAAIKFHIIATVSLILVLYMVINVASFTGMILLAIIVWLLTIMFSIIAFGEI